MAVRFSLKPGFALLASFLVGGAVFSIGSVNAQIARLELHAFQTQTPTDQEFLTGKKDAKPATISGELRLPRAGTDRLPAVVLLHGSGGLSGLQDNWAREFSTIAVATFIVDSFTGRGVTGTQNDQDQLSRWVMIGDAYRALEVLAKHPRIDPARVVVMGFSRGGGAAHYSALKRFAAMHGPAGRLRLCGLHRTLSDVQPGLHRRAGCGRQADPHLPWRGGRLRPSRRVPRVRRAPPESRQGHHADRVPGSASRLRQPGAQEPGQASAGADDPPLPPPRGSAGRSHREQSDEATFHLRQRPVRRTWNDGRLRCAGARRGGEGNQRVPYRHVAAEVTAASTATPNP